MRSLCPSLRSRIWIVVAIALCAGCDDPINSFITECEGPYPDQTSSVYVLPYEPGRTFVVGQGNCSTGSHAKGTLEQYAYDFLMPIGTPVVAARDGIVLLVEERFEDGTQNPSQLNYINITHPDGTIAAYVHLTKDGALVGLNETVVRGQVIAISGNTGVSAEPHLFQSLSETHVPIQTALCRVNPTPLNPEVKRQSRSVRREAKEMMGDQEISSFSFLAGISPHLPFVRSITIKSRIASQSIEKCARTQGIPAPNADASRKLFGKEKEAP